MRKEGLQYKIKKAKELAQKLNLEMVIVNLRITRYNLSEKVLYDLSPIEFLTELANAEYVYTDSFHGTVFSLIYERNFTTVISETEKIDNRKSDVLGMVGLKNRIKKIDDSADLIELMFESSDSKLCYEEAYKVKKRLEYVQEFKILGPVSHPIYKLNNKYRVILTIKAKSGTNLEKINEVANDYLSLNKIKLYIRRM